MSTKREEMHAILEQLERERRLNPTEVIKEASNPESPLHNQFTWNLEEAANERWLDQARQLISSFEITLIVNKKEYRVQEFVERPDKPDRTQGYASISTIKSSRMLAREFIERELAVANGYVRRTKNFAEILGLLDRVEQLSQDIDVLRKDVGEQPEA